MSEQISAKRILTTTAIAAVVGLVVVFAFVAPAEYGVDPLRTGRLLGLTALSDPGQENFALYEGELHHDVYEVEIAPFEGFEYKLDMEEGAGVVFEWSASGPLHIEMHSHPYDAPPDVAEFFDISTGSERRGTYIAQFTGEHGWFWRNEGTEPVTLRLTAHGYFSGAVEYGVPSGTEARQTIDD